MAIIKNDQESIMRVKDNLNSFWFSNSIAYELIHTISAVDKIKHNLWISELTPSEQDKISFLEAIYDHGARNFYTYLKHINPSQFQINKLILQKYKSNICKYVYMLANKSNRVDVTEEQTIKESFWTITWVKKIIQFMEDFEKNSLWKRVDNIYMWEKKSFVPGSSVTWWQWTESKVNIFMQEIINET
jgi:hypothetical protein